jgi:hypothetical protein
LSRAKGIYSTGIETFTVPRSGPDPSILPQLFDGSVSSDRADWPRYFGAALLLQSDPPPPDGHWSAPDWCRELADVFQHIRTRSQDPRWAWTNAVFAFESTRWGCIPDRVVETHRAAYRGAAWGQILRSPGSPLASAEWVVPSLEGRGKDMVWSSPGN